MDPVPLDPAHLAKTAHYLYVSLQSFAFQEPRLTISSRPRMASKMYSLAACVMLFYDIALTMLDEVEKIWMQPQYTYMTLLWTLVSMCPLPYLFLVPLLSLLKITNK